MEGWIKLHRRLQKSHIWANSTSVQKNILITILLMVNHKEAEVEINEKIYHLQPGQCITSVDKIKEKAGKDVSTQQVRTALKRFKKLEFLTSKTTNRFTLLTVCKFVSYQSTETNFNKQDNKPLTTNKNEKNINTIKKPVSIRMKEAMLEQCPELFIDNSQDLPRLLKLSYKIKELVKAKKKKEGHPFFSVTDEEVLGAFIHFIKHLPDWNKENTFYPEYLLNNFSSLINKIRTGASKKEKGEKAPPKLNLNAFKNLQK